MTETAIELLKSLEDLTVQSLAQLDTIAKALPGITAATPSTLGPSKKIEDVTEEVPSPARSVALKQPDAPAFAGVPLPRVPPLPDMQPTLVKPVPSLPPLLTTSKPVAGSVPVPRTVPAPVEPEKPIVQKQVAPQIPKVPQVGPIPSLAAANVPPVIASNPLQIAPIPPAPSVPPMQHTMPGISLQTMSARMAVPNTMQTNIIRQFATNAAPTGAASAAPQFSSIPPLGNVPRMAIPPLPSGIPTMASRSNASEPVKGDRELVRAMTDLSRSIGKLIEKMERNNPSGSISRLPPMEGA